MLFRGLVLTGLRHRFGARAGVVGSGALFALMHLNPWQFIPLLLIGIFISFIVHRTGSLYVGIAAHGTNNLLSLAALNLGRRYDLGALDPPAHLPPTVVLSALVLFTVGMGSFLRSTADSEGRSDGV
jgi:membrane protease YdiL (CAAX protease family)